MLKPDEDEVLTDVRQFAHSTMSGRKVIADMSSLVEATSRLRLSNLSDSERLIRREFSKALQVAAPAQKFSGSAFSTNSHARGELLPWLSAFRGLVY